MKDRHFARILSSISRHIATALVSLGLLITTVSFVRTAHAATLDVGLTSFFTNTGRQETQVENLKKSGYDIAVPLKMEGLKNLGDGAFQIADLDFSSSAPSIPGTARRIPVEAPLAAPGDSSLLYAVVAGIPDQGTCPVSIKETKIAFFDDKQESSDAAAKISEAGYIVYVTANEDVQKEAKEKIEALNCQPNAEGLLVNGKTSSVSVDFTDIWPLLPANLQGAAKAGPFQYAPSPSSDAIYLVNGRKLST
jgi:hypothetical protein